MISTGSSPRPAEKASSKEAEAAAPPSRTPARARPAKGKGARGPAKHLQRLDLNKLLSREPLEFDLLSQVTHMSAVSTAGMTRAQLFAGTASLSYSTSRFFRQVHLAAQRLNYDYSRACEMVAERIKEENVRTFLLHFATSLSSGEPEEQFLTREAELQLETYSKEYERKVESLQKWSDAYVALMVSATLVVVISLVSMMIYPFSPITIVALAGVMVCVTFVGGWIIFAVAPLEVKTHSLKHRSPEQQRAGDMARFLLPAAAIAGLGLGWFFGLAYALIVVGVMIAPIGWIALTDDRKIDERDRDVSTFVRGLGSVMGPTGVAVTDALSRLNRRALGSMDYLVQRLYVRLKNLISPDLSWLRLAAESGSELVTRTVRIFWDGVRVGGETEKVAKLASQFALKISLLRADRKLVSTTFSWVAVPLHAVLMAILLFVTEVVTIFGTELAKVQEENLQSDTLSQAGVSDILLFQFPALDFLPVFVGTVAIMLTAANTFAPYAAAGGHRLKLCFYGAIMLVISGIALILVPHLVQAIFEGVATTPSTSTTTTNF